MMELMVFVFVFVFYLMKMMMMMLFTGIIGIIPCMNANIYSCSKHCVSSNTL